MSNRENVIRQLASEMNTAKKNAAAWNAEYKRLNDELTIVIDPATYIKQAGKDKSGGAATFEIGGVKFNAEAEKKVKWDSKKLQNLAAKLDWKVVVSIFKITFEVSETSYKNVVTSVSAGLIPEAILEEINEARTVKIEEAKIKSAELINQT